MPIIGFQKITRIKSLLQNLFTVFFGTHQNYASQWDYLSAEKALQNHHHLEVYKRISA